MEKIEELATNNEALQIEIAGHRATEEALRKALEETRQAQKEISALFEGSCAVLKIQSFQDAALSIFNSCRGLIGAAAGYIALLSKDKLKNEILFLEAGGLPCTVDPSLQMPIRGGLREEVYRTCKAVYNNDFSNSEWLRFIPEGHLVLRNVLFAPLMIAGEAVGLLGIANKPGDFTENDTRLASDFARYAAFALVFSRTLELLRNSEERYRLLTENASDLIFILNKDMRHSFVSSSVMPLLGYSVEEIMVLPPERLFTPATFALVKEDVAEEMDIAEGATKSSSSTRPNEVELMRKDGSILWAEVRLTTLRDLEGHFTGVHGIARDITERKQMEMKLHESEERYRTIFANTGAATLIIEEDLTISMVNEECSRLTGYAKEDLIGKKWTDFVAQDDLERMEEEFHRRRRMGPDDAPTHDEFKLIDKQGAVRHMSAVVGIIPETKKSVASLLDITEGKEAERKLQETNQNLSSLVKELETRNAEMSQLSEMGEQLQSCQTVEEACAISAQYIQELFPAYQGALYLISPAKDCAEAVNMWGDSTSTKKTFMPSNCWAIRRGRPHLVDGSHPGLLCEHITGSQAGQYLCVPMTAHGETIGILHLNHAAPVEQDPRRSTDRLFTEHRNQLALTVAEHLSLSLSNLRLQETLRLQSIRDILTGLFNRRYMEESLQRELQQAERAGTSVGIIMFDIDHFKDFNDLFGHDGGDALLRELGSFSNTHIRGGDIVSRYGGEEFVAVLPGATLEDTRLRAEELRQGVKELQVLHLGQLLGKCTLSFGVTTYPENGLTVDEILKSADIALYRAKSEGRDRVVVASTN